MEEENTCGIEDYYLCHPNRLYWHIVKNDVYGNPNVYYRTRGGCGMIWGPKAWKHRDAAQIIKDHRLGTEWKIVQNLKGRKFREYRQSKKNYSASWRGGR